MMRNLSELITYLENVYTECGEMQLLINNHCVSDFEDLISINNVDGTLEIQSLDFNKCKKCGSGLRYDSNGSVEYPEEWAECTECGAFHELDGSLILEEE